MLHTMFEVQSIHLQAALWMGMSLSQIKKIPSFWEWPPPPLGITEVPGVYFFPFFYVWVSFFFTRAGQFFFSSHVGQVFFFLLCVGQVFFFFLPLSGSSFFFYKNFLLPPPLKSNGASPIRHGKACLSKPLWRAAGDPRLTRGRSRVRAPANLLSFLLLEIVFFRAFPATPVKVLGLWDYMVCPLNTLEIINIKTNVHVFGIQKA